ncbi:alpha-amylase family glycosyl hydrolase [Pedobacter sp. SL55]|uniref:alpha-amylase family glycosyl hydrolase n=1 Tax=Pedobacter sp. SL55 TaxID=2995161 RepID=UPI0022721BC4|nr:alpha-amylase family glycosyl hydrolase [Pedobacter sp. SL55]WAC42491.1 alpha-amylase family glycosyl hydrolase [Pedobacter sp. SL55]
MKRNFLVLFLACCISFSCKKSKGGEEPSPTPPTPVTPISTELPAGAKEGVVFTNSGTSAIFTLYAPGKNSVSLMGDFNDWSATAAKMTKTPDGNYFWAKVDNINPNTEYAYQFLVDDNLRIADPYCEKILDPVNDPYITAATYPNLKAYPTGKTTGIVSVMQANQPSYTWRNNAFVRPAKNDLVIYELLIRDFTTEHTYNSTIQKLDYLAGLGINAIELLPVNEFEGNLSWGYNPSFYFAPDKYYGTKNDLKKFIDECHGRGIAVILDMVLNHSFSQSPMVQLYFDGNKPTANNPWYNVDAKHPFNVGYDFNHESGATRAFTKNVIKFWMQEYKVDGFRFDLAKGFTQRQSNDDGAFSAFDAGRVAIWDDYLATMKSIDPNFYIILELFANDSEEQAYATKGMMMWNNLNHAMNEATMGWLNSSDFSRGMFGTHGFTSSEGLVSYGESHDEERLTYKNLMYGNVNGSYVIKGNLATSLKRNEMAAAFLFAMPGPKMLWQFGELGYDVNIDFNGRTGEKPIRWNYFDDVNRKALYNAFAKLIRMKLKNSVFRTSNITYDFSKAIKYIKLTDGNNTVVVVGNFDVAPQTANIDFGSVGTWYNAVGSNITLGSSVYSQSLGAGEYHIFSKQPLNN